MKGMTNPQMYGNVTGLVNLVTASPFIVAFGHFVGFPGGSVVKNPLPMQEMLEMEVQSLGREDPLEREMATHSSILA